MTQNDLFAHRIARTSDPETSHQAAAQVAPKLSKRRRQVLYLVRMFSGRTSGEISVLMYQKHGKHGGGNLPIRVAVETPHKRLPELAELGLVRRGRARLCRDSGCNAITWWITDKGREILDGQA